MMKILVTGNRGFIGSHLTPLLAKDYTVRGWDLKTDNDIFDPKFDTAVKWSDVVIHLAAQTSVNGSFDQPFEHFRTNTLGTARVLDLATQYQKKLVYPSSGIVTMPESSPYAQSKALAENLCKEVQKYHPITILRFFNVYGLGMNPDSGSIMYEFLKGALQERILVWGEGQVKRDLINVKDVAAIVKQAISPDWDGQTVEVGTGQGTALREVAEIFSQYSGAKVVFDRAKKEREWRMADPTLLQSLYPQLLMTNLRVDIKEMWDAAN